MNPNPARSNAVREESMVALSRILPRVLPTLASDADRAVFRERVETHFADAFEMFLHLYGDHYDCHYHLEQTLLLVAEYFATRPATMRARDTERAGDPLWFTSHEMMGAVGYVDLFAGTLHGLHDRLPYLQELGITYLHLMPLFVAPQPHNDGGYAVSSFREVDPDLGTMAEFETVATAFRAHGIALVLDFVFNHTSDEHEWARRALAGDRHYQAYYHMFDDRTKPDEYEPFLREIFPDQAPGSFTYRPEIDKWIWTTFNHFQWDLNYANPDVFRAMLGEMLFLANRGADVLRLDAVPFVWKQLGTPSENLPGVHWIIRGFNAFVRMAAPALLFKSEAIVHPRDVKSYIAPGECQLSYNPILMSHLWDALATRETFLMRHAMQQRFALDPGTTWLNYVRSHDDIGWGFADEDAAAVGIDGGAHRTFLNNFYTGQFPGSFAAGVPFNYNPRTGDMRVSGTTAALAGLERALADGDVDAQQQAVQRILLIYGIVLSIGGIPLLYLGDELAALNAVAYRDDPTKADDSRWIHRPAFPDGRAARRHHVDTPEGAVFTGLQSLIQRRKMLPALAGNDARFHDLQNKHIFAFSRARELLVLGNFSEFRQTFPTNTLLAVLKADDVRLTDQLSGRLYAVGADSAFTMEPYELLWLKS
ncbi:MAG: alpha-amylase family protein [Chloroflexota bacterium]|nr:alpha-amylase family protein [Chloroflexota bacterium]